MEDYKALERAVEELTGREKDIPRYCEKLAEHSNKMRAENEKILDADYDQEKVDMEKQMVQIYSTWIVINALKENGYEDINGEWVKVDK